MKFLFSLACAVALAAGLTACGGGGGGDSASSLNMTVSINGSPAAASANGQYAVKPGDTVEITPSQGADWATSGGGVNLRNPSISAARWSAQILNSTASAATYTVTAKASANPSLARAAVLNVSAGDARNGTYRVYATNSQQYQLSLDFNVNAYTFVNQDGSTPVSDTFGTDSAEPGSFFFKTDRVSSVANMSRFRVGTDVVVGAFPFVDPFAAGSYAVKPFIGARKLVTNQADLVGTYNRLGIQRTASAETSQITQTQISAGGTVSRLCHDNTIYSIANCPPGSVTTSTIAATEIPGVWSIVNNANPNDSGRFAMALIGDQKVYLSAGMTPATPGMLVWRLGVQDTPTWGSGAGYGGSTKGSWGAVTVTDTTSSRTAFLPDGTSSQAFNNLHPMAAIGPLGMRTLTDIATGETYFFTYNTKLYTVVGASNPTTGGYLQLSLLD